MYAKLPALVIFNVKFYYKNTKRINQNRWYSIRLDVVRLNMNNFYAMTFWIFQIYF